MARYDSEYDRERARRESRDHARDAENPEDRYYSGRNPERGPFYGRTDYERGRPGEQYRSERYYGPDYSRRGRGYERSRDGGEEEWVLPRLHHSGERTGHYEEDRIGGYRRDERGEENERSRPYDSGRHQEYSDPSEDWLEGSRGRIEYDDPYGHRFERGGPHAGKGPRGYERSPTRILDEVCDRLMEHSDIDASEISVSIEGNEIILTGTVESRRMKRLAEEVADSVASVKDVHNRLTVRRREEDEGEGDTDAGKATPGRRSPTSKKS